MLIQPNLESGSFFPVISCSWRWRCYRRSAPTIDTSSKINNLSFLRLEFIVLSFSLLSAWYSFLLFGPAVKFIAECKVIPSIPKAAVPEKAVRITAFGVRIVGLFPLSFCLMFWGHTFFVLFPYLGTAFWLGAWHSSFVFVVAVRFFVIRLQYIAVLAFPMNDLWLW